MRRPSAFASCLAAVLALATPAAQAQRAPEHELKAAFVFHFMQFTQWPREALAGPHLAICASQDSALYGALGDLVGKPVNNRRIVLRPLAEATAGDCHVVVAGEGDRARLALIRRASEGLPVLTVGDAAEVVRDILIIGIAVDAGRIVFTVDNSRAAKVGLTISSRLLRLAKAVQ